VVPLTLAVISEGNSTPAWDKLRRVVERLLPVAAGDKGLKELQQFPPDLILLPAWLPHRRRLSMKILLWGKAPLLWLVEDFQEEGEETIAEALELGIASILAMTDSAQRIRWVLETAHRAFKTEQALRKEIKEAREALETRKIIDRAKAALVEAWGITEGEAYRRMQQQAMNSRRTLREVAESVLEASGLIV